MKQDLGETILRILNDLGKTQVVWKDTQWQECLYLPWSHHISSKSIRPLLQNMLRRSSAGSVILA